MVRELVRGPTQRPEPTKVERSTSLNIPHDPANEMHVLGLISRSPVLIDKYARSLVPDHFFAKENRAAWAALTETRRRKLDPTNAAFEVVAGKLVADHIDACAQAAEGSKHNIEFHVATLVWDSARVRAASGPLPEFLKAIKDPRTDPERVQALARALAGAFDGHKDRKYLLAPAELVRAQMAEIDSRLQGKAVYTYGLDGLDYYPLERGQTVAKRRMIPGPAPGQVTVITALSGGGKSTGTLRMILGMRRAKRRILIGAWEMTAGVSMELLAGMELGWSRTEMAEGVGEIATREGKIKLEETMHELSRDISFLENPFRRTKAAGKPSNERNLDLLQGYIEDSGCDVFVADLWKRCLVDTTPAAEEEALYRQQAMALETKTHHILLAQQLGKVVEGVDRKNTRPSRETIKGSSAYVEIADTIIAWHRPALFLPDEPDDKIEGLVLKQRHAKWPLAVEFDWNAEKGSIFGGRSVAFARAGMESGDGDDPDGFVAGNQRWNGVKNFGRKKKES